MDFRQLRTFSCVAELGSLSKASDTLRVAQPALSRQIKLLEHELRAELFTRNGRGMVLTDAGRLLLGADCRHRPADRPDPRRYPVFGRASRPDGWCSGWFRP